jgi:eukaryotic-like serine/threonine-protein kinase
LALALAALGALGIYMARPSTADELYAKISSRTDDEDVESMRAVEREMADFVGRFPEDSRTPELLEHLQRIDLDKMHRQLLRHRGGLTDPSLLNVEVLYLKAMKTAETSPETAVHMLESLVKLYATNDATDDSEERRLMCVQLAERQLVQLREDVAKLTERQLSAIQERLRAADRLAETHPAEARQIYQAIVDLYEPQPWAKDVVAEARKKLAVQEAQHE